VFRTLDGFKVESLSVDQMREVDRIAIEETGPTLLQMMENAGSVLAEFICEQWPRGVRVGPVIVLAGAGHNGGGGICAAYHLMCLGGNVCVCLGDDESRLKQAAKKQLARFREAGGRVIDSEEAMDLRPFVIIDALIGYGLHGAPYRMIANLIHWANVCAAPVLSLDVPSGLNADTGIFSHDTASHPCIRATKTLRWHCQNGAWSRPVPGSFGWRILVSREPYSRNCGLMWRRLLPALPKSDLISAAIHLCFLVCL